MDKCIHMSRILDQEICKCEIFAVEQK